MARRKYVVFNNDVAPVHPGVYQREFFRFNTGKPVWKYAHWCNGIWYCSWSKYHVAKYEMCKSIYQTGNVSTLSTLRWRGLTEQGYQNALQKQGR